MAEVLPETIDKATTAIQVAAKPNIFPTLIAIIALGACGFLVWRDEVRADAQIEVLRGMSQHLSDLDGDLRAAGVPVGHTRAVRAAAVVPQ